MQTPLETQLPLDTATKTPLDITQTSNVLCGPECQDTVVFLILGVLIAASIGWVAGLIHEKRKYSHRDTKWEFAMLAAICFLLGCVFIMVR